ncbi:MAG TPA: hypothetical protein VHY21_24225 [Pseudonocardiaceae bacterium]|nr:hypothetical protein [Pseudonocardiaceae bacterium]
MSDTVSFAELDGQHPELLPARTVLSLFSAGDGGSAGNGEGATGTFGMTILGVPIPPGAGNAYGSSGASANG